MQQAEPGPELIELREFSSLIRRRRWSIVLVTILATAIAGGFVAWLIPVYTSRVQVEVRPVTIDEQLQPFTSDSFVNMNTEAARVKQEPVATLAAPALGLDPNSPANLTEATEDVDVTVQANTTFLEISCTESSPIRARSCASSFAAAYIRDRVENARTLYAARIEAEQEKIQQANEELQRLSERLDQLSERALSLDLRLDEAWANIQAQIDAQSQLIVAAETNVLSLPTASPDAAVLARSADLPREPSNKDYIRNISLAAILGLALGIGIALVRERLADTIAGGHDLEQVLEAPVLAVVPPLPARYGRRRDLVTLKAPESPSSQAYRGASAALLYLAREGSLKVIVVTGPSQGRGKATATVNLAVALAQSGRQVVAVSCDLRNPTLHSLLDRSNDVGLTNLLTNQSSLSEVLQETDESGLFVIASGPVPDNSADLLGSEDVRRLLAELRTRFDFVLLDAGPGSVADVLFLAPHGDGVIVVADATNSSRGGVAHLRHQLESAGGLIIAGILNNLAVKHAGHPYRYYLRSGSGTRSSADPVEDRAEAPSRGWSRLQRKR